MKSHVVTSAPGKIVICGEYSVLEGYGGVAAAVNRRVTVTTNEINRHEFIPSQNNFNTDLISCVLQTAKELDLPVTSQSYQFDSSELFQTNRSHTTKLGLGSSAAIAVSLAAQLVPKGNKQQDLIFKLAYLAHQKFNHYRGSGIDVATCCYGGLIQLKIDSPNTLPKITSLEPTFNFHSLLCVFAKKSQNTKDFLKKINDFKINSPDIYKLMMDELGKFSELMISYLCQKTELKSIVELVQFNLMVLEGLGREAGIEVVTKEIKMIADIARNFGGAAKPSGAGGGDIVLCFVPIEWQKYFLMELEKFGLRELRLDFLSPGVQIGSC